MARKSAAARRLSQLRYGVNDVKAQQQEALRCRTEGHIPDDSLDEPMTGLLCARCHGVIDQERYDAVVGEPL
jgi:hypothetical protein